MLKIENLNDAVHILHNPHRHGEMMDACLQLPEWFDATLNPDGPAYHDQQLRLWSEITERAAYDPMRDEDTPEIVGLDGTFRPSFYGSGRSFDAGICLIAMGHILLRSGINEGARVLECGAGFAQNALSFARLGMKVDTLDVSAGYCQKVRESAEHNRVDLTPYREPFGFNPAGHDKAYDLILFFESFHHCFNFREVLPKLRNMLKDNGRILLAGEPINKFGDPNMPYPWGVRLYWTNVAIMRIRGWMELGFQEAYIVRQFANVGMIWRYWSDPHTGLATIYDFTPWNAPIELSSASLTPEESHSWRGQHPYGAWSGALSFIGIPSRDGQIAVDILNPQPSRRTGTVSLASETFNFQLAENDRLTVTLSQKSSVPDQQLTVVCDGVPEGENGVLVERVRPL